MDDTNKAKQKYGLIESDSNKQRTKVIELSGAVATFAGMYKYDEKKKELTLRTDGKVKVILCGVENPPDESMNALITIAYSKGSIIEFKNSTVFAKIDSIEYSYVITMK
jgi:hypothetical protein